MVSLAVAEIHFVTNSNSPFSHYWTICGRVIPLQFFIFCWWIFDLSPVSSIMNDAAMCIFGAHMYSFLGICLGEKLLCRRVCIFSVLADTAQLFPAKSVWVFQLVHNWVDIWSYQFFFLFFFITRYSSAKWYLIMVLISIVLITDDVETILIF